MFHDIPQKILDRMHQLEALDAEDRKNNIERLKHLRQIPVETGKFIAMLAASAPAGNYIEIGTSAGYSALWLTLACRAVDRKLTTFEVLDEKVKLATETFDLAGVDDTVTLVKADARGVLKDYGDISFCFLDAEKKYYQDCYDLIVPQMVKGGILAADNAISHGEDLKEMLDGAIKDSRVDAMIVPVGQGVLVCRKI